MSKDKKENKKEEKPEDRDKEICTDIEPGHHKVRTRGCILHRGHGGEFHLNTKGVRWPVNPRRSKGGGYVDGYVDDARRDAVADN